MKWKRALKVPEKNGEFFCTHNLTDIPALLKSNRELIESYNIKMAGKNYYDYRNKVEKDILNLIANSSAGSFPRPYIATGHQPVLCHPGIWIKNMFVDKIAGENNGTSFDFIVDCDCPAEIGCYLLTRKEKIERKKEFLLKLENHQPIECCAVPDYNQFEEFYKKIKADIQSFPNSTITNNFDKFFQKGQKALSVSKNLSEFLIKTRKGYEEEGDFHYFDIMLSLVCKTDSFLLFVLHIAEDIKQFSEIYNRQLEEYRINHKLRYKANPFPDLKKDIDKFEIPFWFIKDNQRKPVSVLLEGPNISFYADNDFVFRYKKGDFDLAVKIINEKQINFRPKAIPLTLFVRLFFADIFVHGISGAKYDEVTDGIIEKYFKVKPPEYIAASLTLFPNIQIKTVQKEDIDNLKTIIRNIKFKPEMFADKIENQKSKNKFRKLIEEKQKLFCQTPSGKSKKEHFKKLKSITEELSGFLDKYYSEIKDQLRVSEEKEQENQIICYRKYPYFFYDVNMVKEMIR